MYLTGFLHGKNARIFMGELWEHLDSAQNNVSGIPAKMLEQKKEELRQKKVRHNQNCQNNTVCFQVEKDRIRANLEKQEASLKRQGEITRAILEERERDAANKRTEREPKPAKREFKEFKTEDTESDLKRPRYYCI